VHTFIPNYDLYLLNYDFNIGHGPYRPPKSAYDNVCDDTQYE